MTAAAATHEGLGFASKALLALPFVTFCGWSANASRLQMQKHNSSSRVEFVTGSLDDTIQDTLQTGDLVCFTSDLRAQQPVQALVTWLLRRKFQLRFDHLGFVYVDRLGRKFLVEEDFERVQCTPYALRILNSLEQEIVVVPVKHQLKKQQEQQQQLEEQSKRQQTAWEFIQQRMHQPSRLSLPRVASALMDNHNNNNNTSSSTDQKAVMTPLFPAATLIAEAYEAMGFIKSKDSFASGVTAINCTPKDWYTTRRVQFADRDTKFGAAIPIRLQ